MRLSHTRRGRSAIVAESAPLHYGRGSILNAACLQIFACDDSMTLPCQKCSENTAARNLHTPKRMRTATFAPRSASVIHEDFLRHEHVWPAGGTVRRFHSLAMRRRPGIDHLQPALRGNPRNLTAGFEGR